MPGRRDYKAIFDEEGQKVKSSEETAADVFERGIKMLITAKSILMCHSPRSVSQGSLNVCVNSERPKLLHVQVSQGCGHDERVYACLPI